MRRVVAIAFAGSLLALSGGCESMPQLSAPDFARMFAELFGRPLDVPEPQQPPPAQPAVADRVIVLKNQRLLELARNGQVFATYPVALGSDPVGPKRRQGDGRTPEGVYLIDWRTEDTRYTRELHISYPDEQDRDRAQQMRVDPGGAIFIHGLPRDYGPFDPPVWYKDWTEGCISVGNQAIVKIWNAVPDGTPIEIRP